MSPNSTMDRPGIYRIRVHGKLDASWKDFFYCKELAYVTNEEGSTITVMIGTLADQAQVHGELQKLYSLGFALISVEKLDNHAESCE